MIHVCLVSKERNYSVFIHVWCPKRQTIDPSLVNQETNYWSVSAWCPKRQTIDPCLPGVQRTNYWSLSVWCPKRQTIDVCLPIVHKYKPWLLGFQGYTLLFLVCLVFRGLKLLIPVCLVSKGTNYWSMSAISLWYLCLPDIQCNRTNNDTCLPDVRWYHTFYPFLRDDKKKSKDTNSLSISALCLGYKAVN
jgi:hypothetical protein